MPAFDFDRLSSLLPVAISVVLAVADLLTLWLDEAIGSVQLRESFDVDAERSIPTWFSSTQLFLAHATLLLIAWIETHRRSRLISLLVVPGRHSACHVSR